MSNVYISLGMRDGNLSQEVDAEVSNCNATQLYDPVVNFDQDTLEHVDETYYERKPLLNGGARSRSNSVPSRPRRGLYVGLQRSISVQQLGRNNSESDGNTSGSSSDDESTTRLTLAQKKTIVFTAIADLLAYLSLSIMAPFFPEEVSISTKILKNAKIYLMACMTRLYGGLILSSVVFVWLVVV